MGRLRDDDSSWIGSRLETGGHIRGISHCRIVHAQIAPDAPHHHDSSVEALPHLKADPPTPEFVLIGLQSHSDPQGRMDGALRVILVGDRGAEEGHDAVAEELIHRPLIAVHLGQHQLEGAVHEAMDFFRVTPFGERSKPGDIHEQHRHLLALTFESAPGGQDLLSKVFGGICLRRREAGWPGGQATNRLPALETELSARRQLGTAQGARQRETSATLQAKFRLRRVRVLAPGALHVGPLWWLVDFREATASAPKITR
jgi:hypothetical protein